MSNASPMSPHPHELRVAARSAAYPNRTVEDETIRAIDTAVVDKVRMLEQILVNQAQELLRTRKRDEEAAVDLVVNLRNDLVRVLDAGAAPTGDLAARYQELRTQALKTKQSLAAAIGDAEYLMPNAADPYAYSQGLWDKWPLLRPAL